MNYLLKILDRKKSLFAYDINKYNFLLKKIIRKSRFLIIGGAGSIGQATTKEIFKRNPKLLHVVDINENNLVELVRDLRSGIGYIDGEFKTYCLDCGSIQFEQLVKKNKNYDYVINLSALKHVRSERDTFTLSRMLEVNVLNVIKHLKIFQKLKIKKYFCVSSDKATNPVNFMGASKRIMEIFLTSKKNSFDVSLARFANVLFSDGSLLHGFNKRLEKNQPITAPNDVRRYFITPQEAGELCMISCIIGKNNELYFPNDRKNLKFMTFSDLAKKFLKLKGYIAKEQQSENEARKFFRFKNSVKFWPCYFFKSDTSGEKDEEEFYEDIKKVNFNIFKNIGIINLESKLTMQNLNNFKKDLKKLIYKNKNKDEFNNLFKKILINFSHIEKNKSLDEKM